MKFFAAAVLGAVLVSSCASKAKQSRYLSRTQMREIIWDMVRADQYVSDYVLKDPKKTRREESVKLYEQVLAIHKVSAKQFSESLDYYSSRPDLFKPIIDSLANRKNAATPYVSRPGQKPRLDSVNKTLMHKGTPKP